MRASPGSTCLLALLAVGLLSGTPFAQESQPKTAPKVPKDFPTPTEMVDAKSKSLLDRWHGLRYVPTVDRASCDGTVSVTSMMSAQPVAGSFTYQWDGEAGKLEFQDSATQAKVSQFGFRAEMMNGLFADTEWREDFAECKLRATEENGSSVVLVDGKNKNGFKKIVFNEKGLPAVMEMQAESMPAPGVVTLSYIEIDGKFAVQEMVTKLESPMGPVESRMSYEYTASGDQHVWKTYSAVMKMGAQVVSSIQTEFSNYKFDDQVDAPAKKPEPTSKPAK